MPKPRSVEGDKEKEEMAARLVAVSEGRMKVPAALKVAGMSTPLRANDSLRRRVLRQAEKLQNKTLVFVDPGGGGEEAAAPASVATARTESSISTLSGSRSDTPQGLVDGGNPLENVRQQMFNMC